MAPATMTTCSARTAAADTADDTHRTPIDELLDLTRRPWTQQLGARPLLVRPSAVRDLAAVAQLHRRCSARSLLDRYKRGGRPPTAATLDAELRNPYGVVVVAPDGAVVATGDVRRDAGHSYTCAEASLLVEDAWQRQDLGGELLAHLAGVALVLGFTELIAHPGTAIAAAQRLMIGVGRTRMVPGPDAHLHTYLPESATLGLGPVRQRLAS